ncbi:transmembrane protein 248-like [Haliotis cracherodii]|uniref:transmembrane protein 248-like n=1 Tax=Haliotis cracherodii TaxID=6455 RepID=UPI0039E8CA77
MAYTVCENLRGFAYSRPPLVIFMICLATFAIALVTFAYVVKMRDMPNPDIPEDWNTFLESFADVDFCVLSNSSEYTSDATTAGTTRHGRNTIDGQHDVTTTATVPPDGVVNVSLSMMVEMQPTQDFVNIPHNVTYLSTTLMGDQLGLYGEAADLEMNVTFVLPFQWNTTRCNRRGICDPVNIFTCISFQAPVSFFPHTRKPDMCHGNSESGIEYHVKMVGLKGTRKHPKVLWCNSQPVLHVRYKLDPSLTVMLSLHDRSVINLHLMHTSYFLFVMVITLFCYAIIKGRPPKTKIVQQIHVEKIPNKA